MQSAENQKKKSQKWSRHLRCRRADSNPPFTVSDRGRGECDGPPSAVDERERGGECDGGVCRDIALHSAVVRRTGLPSTSLLWPLRWPLLGGACMGRNDARSTPRSLGRPRPRVSGVTPRRSSGSRRSSSTLVAAAGGVKGSVAVVAAAAAGKAWSRGGVGCTPTVRLMWCWRARRDRSECLLTRITSGLARGNLCTVSSSRPARRARSSGNTRSHCSTHGQTR